MKQKVLQAAFVSSAGCPQCLANAWESKAGGRSWRPLFTRGETEVREFDSYSQMQSLALCLCLFGAKP